ncbi:DNA polymerase III, clamp loader complex, gamma/delta/delta subunit, C-terminal [Penicillium expansum]|nr:DNA polymerase III, clamp loader complex, gamma/delta/delta subunit, C-terminal [Penicillium expansum]KGO63703.1 DNA polymerase III, clamp loader complex, gamma/delta/delta subunit, C-terminal [Penicillium expansum]
MDIRNFFGGKSSQGSSDAAAKPAAKKESTMQDSSATRKRRSRKVVDDSDEEEDVAPTKAPAKAKSKSQPKPEETKEEPTTTSDYFASSKKKTRPAKTTEQAQPDKAKIVAESPKPKKAAEEPAIKGRTATRGSTKQAKNIIEDEHLGADDIFATEYGKAGKGDDAYVAGDDSDEDSDFEMLEVKPVAAAAKRTQKKPSSRDDEDDVVMEDLPKIPVPKARPGRKRKSEALIDEDEDGDYQEPKNETKKAAPKSKAAASPAAKKQKASPKKAKKEDKIESKELQDIFDSIPTIDAPEPPKGEPKKFKFGAQQSRDPAMTGTKEMPVGQENCLAGLAFVFTGVLESLGREEGAQLVKKYGGKVVGAPSSKTNYVVLGSDAGPKKLETIAKHKIKTINEEGLFELIRRLPANGGDGKAAEKYAEKLKADEAKVRAMAAEIDAEEKKREEQKRKTTAAQGPKTAATASQTPPSSQPASSGDLWTTKYAPTSTSMICGNKGAVEKIQSWLRNWHVNAQADFKKGGKDGSGTYRAVIIHGPPGIGKTTAAHLVAKLEGFDVVETNASDTRSKKLVESSTLGVLDTTSLQGYFAGQGKQVESEKKKLVLIMDEVDGMSAGDRGGVGAVAAIVKKTKIPIILICNERKLQKMKPFDFITYDVPFRRPTAEQIRARLSTICFREGLKIPPPVLDGLIEGTHADIRQVINMLSTARLDQKGLSYDEGKQMSKSWEKNIILKPWDIVGKILSAQMFSPSSTSTLNDKVELYFNDHEFSYLMLQENYLKTKPALAGKYHGQEQRLKSLELLDNAASSISDGDLVDRMIHGTQQQWSLMPTHAIFSFVRPASFQYGNMNERPAFTSWLGNNSKHGKLSRYVKELQGHMRLRTSGNRDEIRQQYMPLLQEKIIRRMMDEGKDCVDSVIDLMDEYYLTREDFDSMLELGLGPMDESKIKLETQTKATFTRLYNSRSHPMPFMKASNVVAPKQAKKERPDIEDAIEASDEEEVVEEIKNEDEEELDLKKDKYVSLPKKKKAPAKGKKAKKADDEVDADEEKPKKAPFAISNLVRCGSPPAAKMTVVSGSDGSDDVTLSSLDTKGLNTPHRTLLPKVQTTHHALVLRPAPFTEPQVEEVHIPSLLPGSVLLRMLATPLHPYSKLSFEFYNHGRSPHEKPFIPGSSAIARVSQVGDDATTLKVGQLVFFDSVMKGRDSPETIRFSNPVYHGFDPHSVEIIASSGFADGSYAEFMRAPLENCYPLDEAKLMGDPRKWGFAYTPEQLCVIATFLRPFGGLTSIDLKPGETVLISPATSTNGVAACMVALAMGAKVVAWSYDDAKLVRLNRILSITRNDVHNIKTFGPMDAFLDISPPGARGSFHLKSGIMSLRPGGRVSLMGAYQDLEIPNVFVTRCNITLKGNWMYERKDVLALIKMVEKGNLRLREEDGCYVVGEFGLDQWKEALAAATIIDSPSVVTTYVLVKARKMSLLHNEDFTIWQLRSSYLSTIKDGIGDRLINVNDSVLNTPGFRAAGWSTAAAYPNTHSSSHLKRTYSPPIPTTANVSSEYYRLAERNAKPQRHELQGLGLEDGEDDGGMVTGKSHTDMTARRNHARSGKKKSRRERQQEVQRQAEAEDDDSSDLSDDSDDDGDNVGSAVDQIKFDKMPIRRDRADSSPRRSVDQTERPDVMITSASTQSIANQYRQVKPRPRRDTTTSSDLSTDNETDLKGYKQGQVQFSASDQVVEYSRRRRERTGSRGAESLALGELHEEDEDEDSGAESVGSAISSDFDNTAGSGSLLLAGVPGGLNLSSPMAMMNNLPSGTGPQNNSPRKHRTPAPALQDLPPPRPISMIQPVSLLTSQLTSRKRAPSNPVDKFVVLSGRGQEDSLYLKIYVPFSSDPEDPLDLPLTRESKLAEQPAQVTVAETIGLALWKYSADARGPPINRENLTVNRWTLRMVDDGEVEYDFPALGRTLPMTDFTSNNNQSAKSRGRSRGKPYDEFALVEASKSEFEENERLYPQFSSSIGSEVADQPASLAVPGTQPAAQKKTPQTTPARANPILGQPFSSALNHSTLTPADRPVVPISHATPRLGVSKTLKIRFINMEASAHIMTINTSTDSYIAEILDSVCKRWGQDKGNYLLKVMGSNTIAPLDRTVEALGSITELDLVRRRFGGGPLALGTSPGSSSPNAPLMVETADPTASKKNKKEAKKGAQRMLPSSSQKQDHLGGYYRRYHVFRKQPMSFTASNHRILTFENDYMHIVPGDTGKTASGGKTRSISFSDVIGSKVSRRHPKSFRVMIVRGNDATEQKRYDFEARSTNEAVEIVDEIKKNMAHYRI